MCLALQAILERFYDLKANAPALFMATSKGAVRRPLGARGSNNTSDGNNHAACVDLAPVYYYTRASVQGGNGSPCAYGEYLLAYRSAFGYNNWR